MAPGTSWARTNTLRRCRVWQSLTNSPFFVPSSAAIEARVHLNAASKPKAKPRGDDEADDGDDLAVPWIHLAVSLLARSRPVSLADIRTLLRGYRCSTLPAMTVCFLIRDLVASRITLDSTVQLTQVTQDSGGPTASRSPLSGFTITHAVVVLVGADGVCITHFIIVSQHVG